MRDASVGRLDASAPPKPDAAGDAAPAARLPPDIRDWTIAMEPLDNTEKNDPEDAYQLLDDKNHLVRSVPVLLCARGERGKGVPRHKLVKCRLKDPKGEPYWEITFKKIDYNAPHTLKLYEARKAPFEVVYFALYSPRELDEQGRKSAANRP